MGISFVRHRCSAQYCSNTICTRANFRRYLPSGSIRFVQLSTCKIPLGKQIGKNRLKWLEKTLGLLFLLQLISFRFFNCHSRAFPCMKLVEKLPLWHSSGQLVCSAKSIHYVRGECPMSPQCGLSYVQRPLTTTTRKCIWDFWNGEPQMHGPSLGFCGWGAGVSSFPTRFLWILEEGRFLHSPPRIRLWYCEGW